VKRILHRQFVIAPAIVVLIAAVLRVLYSSECEANNVSVPTDNELRQLFRSHRAAFERLAVMGMQDLGLVSILSNDALNEQPLMGGRQLLSPARCSEYKRLLTSIKRDLVMGIDAYKIQFSYAFGGAGLSVGPRRLKGIAYLPHGYEKIGSLVSNLDEVPAEGDIYLVPIAPKWYIIYVQLD
jgi:hypothetical protein